MGMIDNRFIKAVEYEIKKPEFKVINVMVRTRSEAVSVANYFRKDNYKCEISDNNDDVLKFNITISK